MEPSNPISASGDTSQMPAWMTDHNVLKEEYKLNENESPCFEEDKPEPQDDVPEIMDTLSNPLPSFRPTKLPSEDANTLEFYSQNICVMPEYSTQSMEELRWNDIQNHVPVPLPKRRGLFSSQSGIIFLKNFGDTKYTPKQHGPLPANPVIIEMKSLLSEITTPTEPPKRFEDDAELITTLNTLTLQSAPLPDPTLERCGIRLTNPKLYCRPDAKGLDLFAKNGKCLIRNFTVGHVDIGTITFPGQMDVYGANLDNFKFSKKGCVQIYKDGSAPPFRKGFNRPAIAVWKIPSKKDEDQDFKRFLLTLKEYCKKRKANPFWEFVSYELKDKIANWTFKVQLSPKPESDEDLNEMIKEIHNYCMS